MAPARRANAFAMLDAAVDSDSDSELAALASALRHATALAAIDDVRPASGGGQAKSRRRAGGGRSPSPTPTSPGSGLIRGRVPNVYWRASSMDELRASAPFRALPPVDEVTVTGPSTYAWVRQDDQLWSDLHAGVLTSRNLLAVLGITEGRASAALGLQPGMASHRKALHACHALQHGEAVSAAAAARGVNDARVRAANAAATTAYNERLFLQAVKLAAAAPAGPAAADGGDGGSAEGGARGRRRPAQRPPRLPAGVTIGEVRCAWGSAQEASTLRSLCAHFAAEDPGAFVEEAGLCMLSAQAAEALLGAEQPRPRLPPIGASPDGFVTRSSGERLVIEVKNVCPFLADRTRPGGFLVAPSTGVGMARGPHDGPLVSHIPQLQLEMACADVRGGLLASSSACFGINLFKVERDDAYVRLLLHFVGAFYERYVLTGREPPEDFFPRPGDAAEAALYATLLSRTAALAREAALERHLAEPWRTEAHATFFYG
jgi:hypothetical protein